MNYIRKLVGGAIAGVVVATAVSLNRKRISRLLQARDRQRLIEELWVWYEAGLRDIDQFAEAEAAVYVDNHREQLASSVKDESYSESTTEGKLAGFRNDIREVICLDREARTTRVYADRLFELDEGLANEQYWYAKLLIALAHTVRARLRESDLPKDSLTIGL